MRVLITVGATEEPLDPVRYITTGSSGRMGGAMAEEALRRGHQVTLVAARTEVSLPENATIQRVRTARELIIKSLEDVAEGFDVLISTAAIADYTPAYHEKKIKSMNKTLNLKLKPNPKLTQIVKEKYRMVYVVAFKAEYGLLPGELMRAAYTKLKAENLDLVVGNDIKKNVVGSKKNEVVVLNKNGEYVLVPQDKKEKIAVRVWDIIDSSHRKE
ncbi:MAG: phosphopantothenoylcysteine decarboxylase [Candidatus Altiarchaeota archaeon]|nr:phosphopantothenoylcysteine decarboxylase [Candidatus Altiarchaeota archaeon]